MPAGQHLNQKGKKKIIRSILRAKRSEVKKMTLSVFWSIHKKRKKQKRKKQKKQTTKEKTRNNHKRKKRKAIILHFLNTQSTCKIKTQNSVAKMRERKKSLTFTVEQEILDEISRISKKRKMSKAAVYRMILDIGIDCHKDMERVGIIQMVDFGYFVKSAVKEKLKKGTGRQLHLT